MTETIEFLIEGPPKPDTSGQKALAKQVEEDKRRTQLLERSERESLAARIRAARGARANRGGLLLSRRTPDSAGKATLG